MDLVTTIKEHYLSKKAVVNALPSLSLSNVIMSNMEVYAAKMTDWVSLNTRALKSGLAYVLIPPALYLRDKLKDKLGIKNQVVFDGIYGFAFSSVLSLYAYVQSGESDWKKIGIAMLGGSVAMILIGYVLDAYSHLMGVSDSKRRLPRFITERTKRAKTLITGGLVALMLATPLAYHYSEDKSIREHIHKYKKEVIEYIDQYISE